jgi:hypothetical protein
MTSETIERLTNQCNGWTIHDPDALVELGLPQAEADKLTKVFESDFSRGTSTIFVNGKRTNHLRGIDSLDLLYRLATVVNADCSGCVAIGRGTSAEQYKNAIRNALGVEI